MDKLNKRFFGRTGGAAWLGAGLLAVAGLQLTTSRAAEPAIKIPPPAVDQGIAASPQTAVFAGGCFWGVQAVFQHTDGVLQAVSGYTGGSKETATYERIGSGRTGHAEAVQISFDPRKVSYGQLLQIFFSVAHDPTQLDRQGPDTGSQYRSAVFYTGAGQKDVAEKYVAQLDSAKVYRERIVTQLAPLATFYPAEAYHQDYATLHPQERYIAVHDLPKIANLKTMFPTHYRAEPALVMSK